MSPQDQRSQPSETLTTIAPSSLTLEAKPASWSAYALISAALCVGVMCTALVSPLYPIYQQIFGFSHSAISYIHIIYVVGVMVSLAFLGNLNQVFGYWKILKSGCVLMLVGLLLMMLWPTQVGLMSGRFFVGIATGMISTSTLLGMIQTIPASHADKASQYTSTMSVVGFGLGPLLGGVLAELLPFPLVLPFLVMILAVGTVTWKLVRYKQSEAHPPRGRLRLLPQMSLPEQQVHMTFWLISLGAFLAFGIFSFFGSLATSFLHEFLEDSGPFINGLSVAAVLLISGTVQFLCRSISPRRNFMMGLSMLIASCCALVATIAIDLSQLFIAAVVLAGIGHGLILVSTFAIVHRISTPENKSATLSSFLFIGYSGMVLPILVSGYLSDWFGLDIGVVVFSMIMMVIAMIVFFKTWQRRHTPLNY